MHRKKILLTGINGQVGHAILPKLSNYEVIATSRTQLDLSDEDQIRQVVQSVKPDIIINPAAYTAVDKAESEPDLAFAINAIAPRVLAEEAEKLNAVMMHFSTDYVYDGVKSSPYVEIDQTSPKSVYGESKLAGDEAVKKVGIPHLILRTSWVYSPIGSNFLKAILRLAIERDTLTVVADQEGAPTSSFSIATAVQLLLNTWNPSDESQRGVYHFTNTGKTSWHGFACEIINQYRNMNKQPALKVTEGQVKAITSAEYSTPVTRPANSCLDNSKLNETFGIALPDWRDGLQEVLSKL